MIGGARQVDGDVVALDDDGDLHAQTLAAVAAVVVEPALRAVGTVRDLANLLTHHAFGVVHQLIARGLQGRKAILPDQVLEAFHAEAGGRDLRLDVVAQHGRHAAVVAHELPQAFVTHALAVEFDAGEQHALGKDIGNIDDESRRGRADVDVVRGVGREADDLALPEDGDGDENIRAVTRAMVGVVVDDDVALVPLAILQGLLNPLEVSRDGADVQRGRIRFGQGVEIGVEQARAQVFGFPDDRRERHAIEHVAHFLRRRVKGAADHLQGDGIDGLDLLRPRLRGGCPFGRPRLAGGTPVGGLTGGFSDSRLPTSGRLARGRLARGSLARRGSAGGLPRSRFAGCSFT